MQQPDSINSVGFPVGPDGPTLEYSETEQRYAAWFHELDAWTEYWDIYHPETHGRYYFGDGVQEPGLLTSFLPRKQYPPAFVAWTRMALALDSPDRFLQEIQVREVAAAIIEVDEFVHRIFTKHFGDAHEPRVQEAYLDAIFCFALDSLPPAAERDARIPNGDWRKPTAGRHTLDSDLMWFAWALQLEAADALSQLDAAHSRRALMLAGVATGCPANFTWRGHRRTRPEYQPNDQTERLLKSRGICWTTNFNAAAAEIHALYQIREWGSIVDT